jgi:hypothetical protein
MTMRFNLDDYETVESRIKKFYELHPDGRITTQWAQRLSHLAPESQPVHLGRQGFGLPKR